MKSEIIKTADGSHTLFVKDLNEQYHSIHGAFTESIHVFIKNAFLHLQKRNITVFEVGFGTGLNCLLTILKAEEQKINVRYIAIEKFPLGEKITGQLNYTSLIGGNSPEIWKSIHQSGWDKEIQITDLVKLHKLKLDLTTCNLPQGLPPFDVIYFDAFGPGIQPEMWSQEIFNLLFRKCNPGAVITTYSAKGEVRRKLISAGFKMKKLAGPPGKKEMLRGIIAD